MATTMTKPTTGDGSGSGGWKCGAEKKRPAETELDEDFMLRRKIRQAVQKKKQSGVSNPVLKLPPSAYTAVATSKKCSLSEIARLKCPRAKLYDAVWAMQNGVKDGPRDPVDDRGHIVFKPDKNLTPRYMMLSCVGTGTFGKVIMCYDRLEHKTVAVKVIRSVDKYAVAGRNEIAVLTTLMKHDPERRWPFVRLLSWFEYDGGESSKHIVMTFDILGPSLYDTMMRNRSSPFHIRHIRGYARQILESLAYMHGLGIVHTDIKPENLLHTNMGYVIGDVDERRGSQSGAGLCVDGQEGVSGVAGEKRSRSSVNRRPLALLQPSDGKVIICDFGSAAFEDGIHAKTVSTRNYRAPEIILEIGWSVEVDLWSVGCLIMEMVTGTTFFSTSCDKEHLMMMERVLGKGIPREMAERHHERVPNSELLVANGSAVRDTVETGRLLSKKLLDRYFVLKVNSSMAAAKQETKDLKSLVKTLLSWDPKARGTAEAALNHPFFTRHPS